jgi:hypothetical protein
MRLTIRMNAKTSPANTSIVILSDVRRQPNESKDPMPVGSITGLERFSTNASAARPLSLMR